LAGAEHGGGENLLNFGKKRFIRKKRNKECPRNGVK